MWSFFSQPRKRGKYIHVYKKKNLINGVTMCSSAKTDVINHTMPNLMQMLHVSSAPEMTEVFSVETSGANCCRRFVAFLPMFSVFREAHQSACQTKITNMFCHFRQRDICSTCSAQSKRHSSSIIIRLFLPRESTRLSAAIDFCVVFAETELSLTPVVI